MSRATKICIAMVVHSRKESGVFASTDGDRAKIVFLPFKAGVVVEGFELDRWQAVTMPVWLRNDRELHLGNRPSALRRPTSGFCRDASTMTDAEKSEDAQRENVEALVTKTNNRLRPVKETRHVGVLERLVNSAW